MRKKNEILKELGQTDGVYLAEIICEESLLEETESEIICLSGGAPKPCSCHPICGCNPEPSCSCHYEVVCSDSIKCPTDKKCRKDKKSILESRSKIDLKKIISIKKYLKELQMK
jgi:hypothetical protein